MCPFKTSKSTALIDAISLILKILTYLTEIATYNSSHQYSMIYTPVISFAAPLSFDYQIFKFHLQLIYKLLIVGSLSGSRLKRRSLFSRGKRCADDKRCARENHQNQSLIKFIIIIIIENRHLFD
jgi:hypothetical protein